MNVNDDESVAEVDKIKVFDDCAGFKVSGWGYRHQQSLILFFTLTIAYSMRACIGVALVAMTDHEKVANHSIDANNTMRNITTTVVEMYVDADEFKVNGVLNALMITPPYPVFKWSKKIQDTVIASFFWGYMLLQIPAGQLAHKFGARYLLTGAMLINCIISITFPLIVYNGGWICTVICRVVQGLSQACIIPGMHTFFGKWAPLHERGRLASLTYGGQALGTVLGLPVTGFISSTPMGWPGLFRFYGILSGIIGVVLWYLAADTPAKHPKISDAERKHIEDGLGQKDLGDKKLPVPWLKMFRTPGLYAIIIAHIGQAWGQLTLYSEVPAFMDKVMGMNIKTNGLLTALPFLVMWITNFFFSWLTDMLIVKNILSVTNTRKVANSLGCVPAGIGLIVLAYVPKNVYIVETVLIVTCAFKISSHCGFQLNHIDLSPNFAGTMMSLSNFASNLVGSLAPIVAGIILTDVTNEFLWRKVFFVAAGFCLVSNLIYVIFGTAEKAEWNDPPKEKTIENVETKPMIQKLENKKCSIKKC